MLKVTKRNGEVVNFDKSKIEIACQKAMQEVGYKNIEKAAEVANNVMAEIVNDGIEKISIYGIQKKVENALMDVDHNVARAYIEYRHGKDLKREAEARNKEVFELLNDSNEYLLKENSNKNSTLLSTKRDYMAGIQSKEITEKIIYDKDLIHAHKDGLIHIHDMDYIAMPMHNCDVWNLNDMLQNGTVMNGTAISKPKSLATAVTLATQIVIQIAASQYGGQTFSIAHLAPFVRISYEKHKKEVEKEGLEIGIPYTDEQISRLAKRRLNKEVKDAVQTLQYQLISCAVTNGQAPFVSIFMWVNENPEYRDETVMLIKEILKQRRAGIPNENGVPVTIAFPKLLYVLDETNTYEGQPYFWLTKDYAVPCTIERMVPDYISAKKMREYKGDVFGCMGCRSFLTPDDFSDRVGNIAKAKDFVPGKHKYYGRFNQGVCTLNLADVALSSGGDEKKFWKLMEERSELIKRVLMIRHKTLLGTKSDVAPILWQYGALARLEPGEVIDPLLSDGYSTISFGYVGLHECTLYMKGVSHVDPAGTAFAMKVMQFINDKCSEWKAETNIAFSPYGTPEENTTDKFAKALKKRFGIVKGITDHDYVTNSYHVNPAEPIDAFTKLTLEGQFQKLSQGGCISYVELPNMKKNPEAVLKVVQHIYETVMYAEINLKLDYCNKCGFEGEMRLDDDDQYRCPNCGNDDYNQMHIVRRVCGYLSSNWPVSHGRFSDLRARVLHLEDENFNLD